MTVQSYSELKKLLLTIEYTISNLRKLSSLKTTIKEMLCL